MATSAQTITLTQPHSFSEEKLDAIVVTLDKIKGVTVGAVSHEADLGAVYIDVDLTVAAEKVADEIALAVAHLAPRGMTVEDRYEHPVAVPTEPIITPPIEVMSMSDIEKALGLGESGNTVRMWRTRGQFPLEEGQVSNRPVWRTDTIVKWAAMVGRDITVERLPMEPVRRWPLDADEDD